MIDKIIYCISLQKNIPQNKIEKEHHFSRDLGMDSLDIFQLIASLEDDIGIDIDIEAIKENLTVEKMASYLQKNQKGFKG